MSGKVSWKNRKIPDIVEDFKKGDPLIVRVLSRLGRSMPECMEIHFRRGRKRCQRLRRQRQLVAQEFDSKQNLRNGFFAGTGNRTRFNFAAHERSPVIPEEIRHQPRQTARSRQINTRRVLPGSRSLDAKRLDSEVYRAKIRHNRSQSSQLAEKNSLKRT
jgi:hypothetical protein